MGMKSNTASVICSIIQKLELFLYQQDAIITKKHPFFSPVFGGLFYLAYLENQCFYFTILIIITAGVFLKRLLRQTGGNIWKKETGDTKTVYL